MQLARFPRARLAHLPTPLEPLDRLSRELGGPTLFVKRDDCTGLATGGNKTRKLEFLLADALRRGADTIVTEGGAQSNHCRQTAAAAAKLGLACHLVLQSSSEAQAPDYEETGNVLLERLLGAELHFVAASADRSAELRRVAEGLEAAGRTVCTIPTGGSNAIGGLGYVSCAFELLQQAQQRQLAIDAVVHASGSGGTQGGLVVGFAAANADVATIGFDVTAVPPEIEARVRDVVRGTADLLGLPGGIDPARVILRMDQAGPAYAVVTDAAIEAIQLAARLEGLLLDPVYTAKAFAGLIALVRDGYFKRSDNVVFLHTGGTAALPAYTTQLTDER